MLLSMMNTLTLRLRDEFQTSLGNKTYHFHRICTNFGFWFLVGMFNLLNSRIRSNRLDALVSELKTIAGYYIYCWVILFLRSIVVVLGWFSLLLENVRFLFRCAFSCDRFFSFIKSVAALVFVAVPYVWYPKTGKQNRCDRCERKFVDFFSREQKKHPK